jgi:hypothetical protein
VPVGVLRARPRHDHHSNVAAEIPRARAYSCDVSPLRFHAATSVAHSVALRGAAFVRTFHLVVFAMPGEWCLRDGYALRQPVRGLLSS